tara:strand:- start:10405 stop:11379 length:975 start_codon:yes stop_codon:yes gene_type:complete
MQQETQLAEANDTINELGIFSSGGFNSYLRIAGIMAGSSLVPETLKGDNFDETQANCFRVVEQSARWTLSPFAVLDCASLVHGKLMWEGKLIAAVLEATAGITLEYEYSGSGQQRRIVVYGEVNGKRVSVEGTVADWKTTGKNSPWDKEANHDQQLSYRGSRQWARRYKPAVILGVYAPDEMEPEAMRNVTKPFTAPVPDFGKIVDPAPEREAQPDAVPENTPNPDPDPDPVKVAPVGRQKKERNLRTGTFRGIAEKGTPQKPWFVVKVGIDDKVIELVTFSQTMAGELREMAKMTEIRMVIVKAGEGFGIDSFQVVETSKDLF